jgi:hypothetical protein
MKAMATTNKGFGKSQQRKTLIDNWMLPEMKVHFKSGGVNANSALALLNILAAQMTLRNVTRKKAIKSKPGHLADLACAAHSILSDIDSELLENYENIGNKMRDSDAFYIGYIYKLYALLENKVKNNMEISTMFSMCEELKTWKEEQGFMVSPPIHLINGFVHPFSDMIEANGTEYLNPWFFASLICGSACGRMPKDESNPEASITMLVNLGVLQVETMVSRLNVAKCFDPEYLKLVSEAKEAFESKLEQSFDR